LQDLEQDLLDILESCGIDILCSLPCDRVKRLICMADGADFIHLHMTREEEGVGICAGAALAGKRAAMIVQSSGVGNMINALVSLTGFYELPLAIFVSHRGVHKEGIEAQVPLGQALPGLLESLGIPFSYIRKEEDIPPIEAKLEDIYTSNKIHAFLVSPEIWESSVQGAPEKPETFCPCSLPQDAGQGVSKMPRAELSRYEAIDALKGAIKGNVVIGNIGAPSKELYELCEQPSNFYMLGSMGMATPIGMGVALFTNRKVFVIDGDGSLLMNPGTLATVASTGVNNLIILAIDNASYGSTGCQPTLTGSCVELETVAKGFGIRETLKAGTREEIMDIASLVVDGPLFVHIPAISGNQPGVSNIPLDKLEIRDRFREFLAQKTGSL
jgi:sulfopyruvate decarboxylase subunit beta